MACFPNATVGGPARRVKSDAAASRTATPRKQLAAKHKSPLRRADKFQGGVAQQVGDLMELEFEYPEDRMFFANLLAAGDKKRLDEFRELFDFRHQAIKRWEFNKVRKKLFAELMDRYGGKCQLNIHPDCSKEEIYEPDHIIPLATNELNKKLRGMAGKSSEKVVAQSFGSNNIRNLTLACKRCNAFKKHRIIFPGNKQ